MTDAEKLHGRSDAELQQWGEDNIQRILDELDGTASDIITIKRLNADEVWDALALANAYRRTFIEGKPWDVGISIDASQSGIQILASSLLDREAMLATNVLALEIKDNGPVDGYRAVLVQAIALVEATKEHAIEMGVEPQWLDRHILDPEVAEVVLDILKEVKARKVSKVVCLPLVYGAQLPSLLASVRRSIRDDLKIDLETYFTHHGDKAFETRNRVVTEVTCYLPQGED